MDLLHLSDFFNSDDIEYIINDDLILNEAKDKDIEYVPKFSLKTIKGFENVPINEPILYDEKIMIKAIEYGMIFLISYKGEKDKRKKGHERVIQPMVLGRSSKGNVLLRGWHLSGWSVSNRKRIKKIWRMFRTDRILSMTFTGSFYRLPPKGYNMNDKGMRGGIIVKAEFGKIRRNQESLVKQNLVRNRDDVSLDDNKLISIRVSNTNTKLDITKAIENPYLSKIKNSDNIRITFLKSVFGEKYIAILGAMGEKGNSVKVYDKFANLGIYKVLDSTTGKILSSITKFKGNSVYDLYLFDKKL